MLLEVSLKSRLHDFGKEEDYILAHITPFSLSPKRNNKMRSNIQMELIDLKPNSSVNM